MVIKDGRVNLTAKVLAGKTVTAELPLIELKDVGGQKEGVSPAKAFNLILAELYKQMQSPDVTAALGGLNLSLSYEIANFEFLVSRGYAFKNGGDDLIFEVRYRFFFNAEDL